MSTTYFKGDVEGLPTDTNRMVAYIDEAFDIAETDMARLARVEDFSGAGPTNGGHIDLTRRAGSVRGVLARATVLPPV